MKKSFSNRIISSIIAGILLISCIFTMSACGGGARYIGSIEKQLKILPDTPTTTMGSTIIFEGTAQGYEYNQFTLYFSEAVDKSTQDRFLKSLEQIFKTLNSLRFEITDAKILITESVADPVVQEDFVILPINIDFTTLAQYVVQAPYGGWANYGLTYAFANHIAKLTDNEHIAADENALTSFLSDKDNERYLDFSAPCFSTTYTTESELPAIQNAVVAFWEYLEKNKSLNEIFTLFDDSESRYTAEKDWLNSLHIKIDYIFTDIEFKLPSYETFAVAKMDNTVWYIMTDFIDVDGGLEVPVDIMRKDYENLLFNFNAHRALFNVAEDFFEPYITRELTPLSVVLTSENNPSFIQSAYEIGGFFYPTSPYAIYIRGNGVALHEYIHYLQQHCVVLNNSYKMEFIAGYYSFYLSFVDEIIQGLYSYEKESINYATEHPEVFPFPETLNAFEQYLGRNLTPEDWLLFADFSIWHRNLFGDPFYHSNYVYISFINYLLQTHTNEEILLELLRNDNIIFGKSLFQLSNEWKAYIKAKFEQ